MTFRSPQQLIDNIKGSFENLTNRPGNYQQGLYQDSGAISKVLTNIRRENWNKSFPYTFAVTQSSSDLTPVSGFSDFPLPINPEEITQEETFAINIRPTQGGTIVNHFGNKYKDLTISGTTGVSPHRGAGGVRSSTGDAIFQPKELRYASGYEVFLRLRNYFKSYYEYKKTDKSDNARQSRLVFKNFKDGEFLIIEVPKFTMKRNATRPFLYDYTITARVLGSFEIDAKGLINDYQKDDGFFSVLQSALDKIDTARGIFLRQSDILRQVEATFDQAILEPMRRAALALKALIGVGIDFSDVAPGIVRRSLTTLDTIGILLTIDARQRNERNTGNLDPRLQNVQLPVNLQRTVSETGPEILLNLPGDSSQALEFNLLPLKAQNEVITEQNETLELPRSFYSDIQQRVDRVLNNAYDVFNFNDPNYDALLGRSPTSTAEPTRQTTDDEFEAIYGLEQALIGLNQILSTNVLFKSSYGDRIEDVNSRFDEDLNLRSEQAVKEIVLPTETTLERLALRELGDASRWGEIVELNNLKPPYVVQDESSTLPNVKRPGEKILIPQPIRFGFGTSINTRETFLNRDLSELEKNLGIDLKLSSENDLILTNKNDLELIRGADNAVQAILLKLAIEKGEILDHPTLGIGLQIGSKMPPLVEVQTDIINTLTQDARFERIEDLRIERENSTVRVRMFIKLKNLDIPIPIDLKF